MRISDLRPDGHVGLVAKTSLRVLVVVVLVLLSAPAAADSFEDLALDLQMIPLDGQRPPAFTLSALDGKPVSLAEFSGQVVLLYFWATW